jgi:hypothetical protein
MKNKSNDTAKHMWNTIEELAFINSIEKLKTIKGYIKALEGHTIEGNLAGRRTAWGNLNVDEVIQCAKNRLAKITEKEGKKI